MPRCLLLTASCCRDADFHAFTVSLLAAAICWFATLALCYAFAAAVAMSMPRRYVMPPCRRYAAAAAHMLATTPIAASFSR